MLKLLPNYIRTPKELSDQSNVFQTYTGFPIPSSRVIPIIRDHLSLMGIEFSGTITDLRKAAATLTAKHDPKSQDIMSLFLGHSRKAHDHYYKMNIGHDGLTEAFNNLETFQTFPDAEPSRYVTSKYPTSNISPAKVYSSDIRPVLTCLKQRFSDEIFNNTLLSMIKALGFNGKFVTRNGFDHLHTSSEILNLSDNTQKYFRSMAHHKSIFS